jgi:hypothetical protein
MAIIVLTTPLLLEQFLCLLYSRILPRSPFDHFIQVVQGRYGTQRGQHGPTWARIRIASSPVTHRSRKHQTAYQASLMTYLMTTCGLKFLL